MINMVVPTFTYQRTLVLDIPLLLASSRKWISVALVSVNIVNIKTEWRNFQQGTLHDTVLEIYSFHEIV